MRTEEERYRDTSFAEGAVSILSIFKHNSREIKKIYVLPSVKSDDANIKKIFAYAMKRHVRFESASEEFFNSVTTGHTHGGIIAEVGGRKYTTVEKIFSEKNGFVFMLCGIEDPFNFGDAVRSFYSAGATGFVTSPRNWLSAAGVTLRSSAGATEMIECAVSLDNAETIRIAKENGYKVVCAAEKDSTELFKADLKKPIFLIIGGEKRGISKDILSLADEKIRIPYGSGFQGSLTAASASAVCAFEVLRQNKK